jgi:hypothetical protein
MAFDHSFAFDVEWTVASVEMVGANELIIG